MLIMSGHDADCALSLSSRCFLLPLPLIRIQEGLITMGIAIISFFLLPESPEHASWLTPEEKALAAARVKSENVGSTEVIDQMHGSVVWHAMFNPTTLVNCFIFLLVRMAKAPSRTL